MENIRRGYYTANAFNLGDILIDIRNHEKRENVVFYPRIFRYKRIVVDSTVFWINEYGSGVSLQRIPGANSLKEARKIYNRNEYYYPTYNALLSIINHSFKSNITDTDISFIVEISNTKNKSEYALISILANQHFNYYLAVFIESIFILQLCRLLERKLVSLVSQRKSYNSQRILTEFVSSLFIVEKPQGYLPNHNEFEYMKEMYEAWKIDELISTLKDKYDLSLTNYRLQVFFRV